MHLGAASRYGMGARKPKLLVLGGPHVDADALGDSLGELFELVESSPGEAIATMEYEGCQVVLAEAGDFVPLERGLVGRQSSMLLNAIGEGVCLSDVNGRVLWSNTMYRGFHEAVRRRVGEVCIHGAAHFRERLVRSAEKGGHAAGRAKRYRLSFRKHRRFFEVMVSAVVSRAEDFAPSGVAGGGGGGGEEGNGRGGAGLLLVAAVVRDVTSSVRIEHKIDAIDRAGRELAHMDAETIRKMHAQERLRLLQERIVKYADELLHFDHFAIRMLNRKTNSLDLVMAVGIPEKAKEIQLFAEETGNGTSGRVAATGQSYICEDTTADPLYVYGLDKPGSSLTVPLRVYDEVVGTFNVESSERGAFTENDRQFAEIFASYMASALHTLNLLVVERYTTSEAATGTVHGEISGPLNDLVTEVDLLKERAGEDNALQPHLERILRDAASIRKRMKNVAKGPQSLLGVDEVLEAGRIIPELENRRVLVADNDESMLGTVRDVLTAVGCKVVTCDDGTSAIRLLETWQHTFDADEGFDLVLSDINLGDKTGYEVFGAAKRARVDLPVVLMTGFGYDPHHSIVRATQEGLQSVLFKPFQAEKLIEETRKAMVGAQGVGKGPAPAEDGPSVGGL